MLYTNVLNIFGLKVYFSQTAVSKSRKMCKNCMLFTKKSNIFVSESDTQKGYFWPLRKDAFFFSEFQAQGVL